MDKYQIIGKGMRGSWPYEVAVHWPGKDAGGPIMRAKGSGYSGAGGNFVLFDMLDTKWDENLQVCDCLWLRDLAREEVERGQWFSADEIWQRAQERK